MSLAHVLYVDHQGHPAPLSCCYHATASRRLSSSVHRYPPSTLTEVDSAYCPQCLSVHDVASAASLAYCPRPQCRRCPVCTAVATIFIQQEEKTCFYKCGYCTWTSKECNIEVALNLAGDGSVGKEQVAKAAEELGEALQERVAAGEKDAGDHFRNVVEAWGKIVKEEVKRQTQGNVMVGTRRNLASDSPEGWSIDILEESIRIKREKAKSNAADITGGHCLVRIPLDDTEEEGQVTVGGVAPESTVLQAVATAGTRLARNHLVPLPIPLRPRKSRRCRAELADGRPGILVKPKLNPLEGDSSLRTGHGQWWKKDSSAIHVVPKVQVVQVVTDAERKRHALLIKVKNPTLGVLKLRLGQSEYNGEPDLDGEGVDNMLVDLLVDSLSMTRINAELDTSVMNGLNPTDLVDLEPVKDAFLELGMTQSKEPPEVETWNASEVLSTSKVGVEDGHICSTVRSIAKDNDTAWFELVTTAVLREDEQMYTAVPIALQIQVGDGSWESSLVKPSPAEGTSEDFVSIDLVIAWPGTQ